MSDFIYKLNAMEVAAQSDDPSKEGYGSKRVAVFKHVADLERENADLRAELNDLRVRVASRDIAIGTIDDILEACAEVLGHDVVLVELPGELAALRAELEAVRKDAERYRHLRDHGGADLFGGTSSMSIGKHPMIVYFAPSLNHANMVSLFAENADYMVDAAIAQGKGEK